VVIIRLCVRSKSYLVIPNLESMASMQVDQPGYNHSFLDLDCLEIVEKLNNLLDSGAKIGDHVVNF